MIYESKKFLFFQNIITSSNNNNYICKREKTILNMLDILGNKRNILFNINLYNK